MPQMYDTYGEDDFSPEQEALAVVANEQEIGAAPVDWSKVMVYEIEYADDDGEVETTPPTDLIIPIQPTNHLALRDLNAAEVVYRNESNMPWLPGSAVVLYAALTHTDMIFAPDDPAYDMMCLLAVQLARSENVIAQFWKKDAADPGPYRLLLSVRPKAEE